MGRPENLHTTPLERPGEASLGLAEADDRLAGPGAGTHELREVGALVMPPEQHDERVIGEGGERLADRIGVGRLRVVEIPYPVLDATGLDAVLERYGVSSVDDMTEETYRSAMNSLRKTKNRAA